MKTGIELVEDGPVFVTHVVLDADAAIVEGPRLPDLRWIVRDGERILQQATQMQRGTFRWIDWRDVPAGEDA